MALAAGARHLGRWRAVTPPDDVPRLYVVQSNPVAGREDEFDAWYADHLAEVVALPGFRAAQRYRRGEVRRSARYPIYPYSDLAIYEVDGDPRRAFDALDHAWRNGMVRPTGLIEDQIAHVFDPLGRRVEGPPDR